MRRPRFHLTPVRNWLNDPNGLVHHDGLWHAYFQYNPEGVDWGNMSWGHATSRDLRTWDEQPVALRYSEGEGIFSGSAVDAGDELVAYFTSARPGHQAQHRAVSTDGGFTWDRDTDGPALDRGTAEFRDPKVVRYPLPSGETRWILVAVEAVERRVLFYASSDLRTWEEVDSFGPVGPSDVVWECPDLVRLPVDGSDSSTGADARWVLILSTNAVGEQPDPVGSTMHYVVGDFDGIRFTPDSPELVSVDHGRDMYAGVSFDSAPGGEVVMLGWMSNWRYAHVVPATEWRGAMSLPRVLSLRTVDGALRLVQTPVGFVADSLAGADTSSAVGSWERELDGHTLLEVEWDGSSALSLRISGSGGFAEVECAGGSISLSRGGPAAEAVHPEFPVTVAAPLLDLGRQQLVVSLDGPLLEVFADEGATVLSSLVMLGDGAVRLSLSGANTVKLVEM